MINILQNHPYCVFTAFFAYIAFMALFLNANISALQSFVEYDFLFHILSFLVCVVLLLPSVFHSTHSEESKKPSENKLLFYAKRLCSGFFFAWGSCFFVNSIIVTKDFIEQFSGTDITWLQTSQLAVLAISALFLLEYFFMERVSLLSFLGGGLFLLGFTWLFFPITGEALSEHYWYLSLSKATSMKQGWPIVLYHILMFGSSWLMAIRINRIDACYFKDTESLWFSTLVSGCVALIFSMPLFSMEYADCMDLLNQGLLPREYIGIALFGVFLYVCIKAFCFFETKRKNADYTTLLAGWILSVTTLVVFAFLYSKQFAAFPLKIIFMAVGVYFLCKPCQPFPLGIKSAQWKRDILLFLLAFLLVRVFLMVFYFSMRGGLELAFLFNSREPFDVMKYINNNGSLVIVPLAVLLCVYLRKKYPFAKNISLLLNYVFACIASFLTVSFLKEYISGLLLTPVCMLIGYFPQPGVEIPEQVRWITRAEVVFSLLLAYYSIRQGIRSGKRLILWTVLSNLMLVTAFGKMFFDAFVTLGYSWIKDNMAFYKLLFDSVPLIVALFILLSAIIIYKRKSLDEKVLPALLRCRFPRFSEKPKIEEAVSILREKSLLADDVAIKVFVSQTTETNAYTIGDKSIAITAPLLQKLSSRQLAGVISHELGHISHQDGRLSVLLYVLNLPTVFVKKMFNAFSAQRSVLMNVTCFLSFLYLMYNDVLLFMFFDIGGVFAWFVLQAAIFLMENKDTQDSEWRADSFAASNGLGQELKEALMQMATNDEEENTKESWMERYPGLAERIQRLETLQNSIGA